MFGKAKAALCLQGGWRTWPAEFCESLTRMLLYTLPKHPDTTLELFYIAHHCIDVGRNRAVKNALDWGADFFLFVDLDQALLPDTLERLGRALADRPDLDIISPLISIRHHPFCPCALNVVDAKDKYTPAIKGRHGVIEVDLTGTGCLLIRRRVFELTKPPWFKFVLAPDGTSIVVGEDQYFGFKCKAAGLKIGIDLDHEIGHLSTAYLTVSQNWAGKETVNPDFPIMDRPKEPSRFDWQRHVEAFDRGEVHLDEEQSSAGPKKF